MYNLVSHSLEEEFVRGEMLRAKKFVDQTPAKAGLQTASPTLKLYLSYRNKTLFNDIPKNAIGN